MKRIRLLHWLRSCKPQNKADTISHTIEDALEVEAQQLLSIDPDTDGQWRRLKITLESKHTVSDNRFASARRGFLRPAFSLALTAVVLIVVGVIWLRTSSFRMYETAKGQHSTILLQDSTEVTLNYLTELKVNRWSLEKTRRVELKGEALFHVRRNGTPFIITTSIGTVQVLGTQFNVRVRDDRMEVAVLSGSVKISANRNGTDSSIVLTQGQITVCEKNSYPGAADALPFSEYPGWIQGKFMFYRTTLGSACKEIESQFDVKIRFERPQLRDITLTGIINSQTAETALTTLIQLTGNKLRYEDGGYTIY